MTFLLCFFFFLLRVVFNSFFTISVQIENARLKPALVISTGAPMTVENDAIEILPAVTDKKQLMTYQNSQKSNIFTKFL